MKVNEFGMLMSLVVICAVSSFVILSAAGIPLSEEQPSQESSNAPMNETSTETTKTTTAKPSEQNASVEESADTTPPLVFPTIEDNVLPKNETALKILQSVSVSTPDFSKSSSEDTKPKEKSSEDAPSTTTKTPLEVTTVSVATIENSSSSVVDEKSVNSTLSPSTNTTEEPEEDYDNLSGETGKSDVEEIQDISNEQESELEENFTRTGSEKASINLFEDPVTSAPAFHSGHFALIFASTLVILSVVAYIGLILWRSRLETRYGTRQRLVTEDVFYSDNQNDVRYFGL